MRANYSKLFNLLKSRNITQNDFRIDVKLSNATIQNLRHNKNVTIDIICRICDYLNVHPNDIFRMGGSRSRRNSTTGRNRGLTETTSRT